MFTPKNQPSYLDKRFNIVPLLVLLLAICCVGYTKVTYAGPVAVGSFATKFNIDNTPRVTNLKLAAEAISGVTLAPGDTFSYNETVGPTTQARGYQKAEIIVKGQKKQGYGGGVCQVSSTLFNAAEKAGLEILERHPHSKQVPYVEKGKDAATSYGGIDLKFKNTLGYPVKVSASVMGSHVYVDIYKVS